MGGRGREWMSARKGGGTAIEPLPPLPSHPHYCIPPTLDPLLLPRASTLLPPSPSPSLELPPSSLPFLPETYTHFNLMNFKGVWPKSYYIEQIFEKINFILIKITASQKVWIYCETTIPEWQNITDNTR